LGEIVFEVKNLSKTYSGITVLKNVSFDIKEGEVHALCGENGAGKSTLIKMVAGVEVPDKGSELYYRGKLEHHVTPEIAMNHGLSVIYQDISLFPNLTIAENICISKVASYLSKIEWKSVRKMAAETLKTLGIDLDINAPLGSVSVGKQQIVAIARALAANAKIIIMDEPTAALSSSEVETLLSIVKTIKKEGVGIVYITHKLSEVFAIADRVSVLRDGEVVSTDVIGNFDQDRLIHDMVGRDLRFIPMHNEKEKSDEVIFEVKNLTCEPYCRNISLKVKKHEILGLTGLVGAGRSELAQTIFGLFRAQSGEVFLKGKKLKIKEPKHAIKAGIAYLPEDRRTQSMFTGQSVTKNITVASLDKVLGKMKLISKALEYKEAEEYIARLQIRPDRPGVNIETMSGGNQQKVMLARWLDTDPKLLIVDEPTTGIDVGAKLEIHKILRNLADQGVAVILISSDLPEVIAISDRIVVMRQGNFVAEIAAADATQEAIIERGILG